MSVGYLYESKSCKHVTEIEFEAKFLESPNAICSNDREKIEKPQRYCETL